MVTASARTSSNAGSPGSVASPGSKYDNGDGALSVPDAPLGNATLSIVSGFLIQAGSPNPLAGRPYVLLRNSYGDALAKGGVSIPAGMSPYKYAGTACDTKSPDFQTIQASVKANAISAARADANGSATLPGVPPGTYYLMVSAFYNKQPLVWGQAVQVHAGQNSLTLNLRNATPLN
jgi:hypothetical protein